MGILEAAKPIVVISTRNRARATIFYRDILGLEFVHQDKLATIFKVGGIVLRISPVAGFSPHEHTIIGFHVPDVAASVRALREKGVTFNIYSHLPQDELGIFSVPGGSLRVAWFNDPDGNVLSVTND